MATELATQNPGGIEFIQPEWLWLLPLFVLITLLIRRAGKHRSRNLTFSFPGYRQTGIIHPLQNLLPKKVFSMDKQAHAHRLAMWTSLIMLIISLSQPVKIGEKIPDPPQQKDIVFIVDTSVSMILRDYDLNGQRIERMSLLKTVLDEFTTMLQGNRISVIVFGDSAHTYIPLTQDQDFIRRQLSRIETGMAGRFKAVGDAIALAVKQSNASANRHRVLILFTDMHRATGRIAPQTAAAIAAQAGIPLFTVAIGATTLDAEEQRASGLLYAPANLELLKNIAERTGGLGFHASDANAFKQAIKDIVQREMVITPAPPRYYKQPLYQWPLLFSLMLISAFQLMQLMGKRR